MVLTGLLHHHAVQLRPFEKLLGDVKRIRLGVVGDCGYQLESQGLQIPSEERLREIFVKLGCAGPRPQSRKDHELAGQGSVPTIANRRMGAFLRSKANELATKVK